MSLQFRLYDPETGNGLGEITQPSLATSAEFRLYGGCDIARASFACEFGDPPVAEPGNGIVIARDGVDIFNGRVRACEPAYGKPEQEIIIEGWWYRVAERQAVIPALDDHIIFGQADDSDHPAITTAFGVATWIAQNRLANDPAAQITVASPSPGGLVRQPDYPCKLAGPFMLYAKDDLAGVLETLATMEDCVTGIDSKGRFYYLPRADVEAGQLMEIKATGTPPANWRSVGHGLPTGSGRFVYDRRGPNSISIYSRGQAETGEYVTAIRDYHLAAGGDYPPETARTASYRAAGVYTGPQARRLARGLFRRFSSDYLRVEQMEVQTGTMEFEPHLGRVKIVDGGGDPFADGICGKIAVEFDRTTLRASVTIGELAEDPGSQNPVTDPWTGSPGPVDDPQIDTGEGDLDFPLPSGEIDLDDAWDGDGDDFHQNPIREFPTDPPGTGVEGVDYGNDRPRPQQPDGQGPVAGGRVFRGQILSRQGEDNYTVQVYQQGNLTTLENIAAWPRPAFQLVPGQMVQVYFPPGEAAYIDGAVDTATWPGRVTVAGEEPTVEVLDPDDLETALGSFEEVKTWPAPAVAPEFQLDQEVFLTWFPGQTGPVIIMTGGGGGCAASLTDIGAVLFG